MFIPSNGDAPNNTPPTESRSAFNPSRYFVVFITNSIRSIYFSVGKKTNRRKWKQIKLFTVSPVPLECQFHVSTRTISVSLPSSIWINANDAMCWMCFGCNGIGDWIFRVRLWKRRIDWIRQLLLRVLFLFELDWMLTLQVMYVSLKRHKSQRRPSIGIYVM